MKWEYATADGWAELHRMGERGWEAYAVNVDFGHVSYFMKRPISEGEPE